MIIPVFRRQNPIEITWIPNFKSESKIKQEYLERQKQEKMKKKCLKKKL